MKIATILTEKSANRKSHFLALEMDERLESMGLQSDILDLADPSYRFPNLSGYDHYLLIGTNQGPLYSNETHQIITKNRNTWRNRRVASVMVTDEKMLGDAADIQLKLVLKTLGANLLPDQLVITDPQKSFDGSINLVDHALNSKIDQFLYLFVYGKNLRATEKLIA